MSAADEIATLMGPMPPDELEQRARILTCRNVATFRAHRTGGPNARGLLWMAGDMGTAYAFSHSPLEQLTAVAELCRDLISLSERANELEADDGLANT